MVNSGWWSAVTIYPLERLHSSLIHALSRQSA